MCGIAGLITPPGLPVDIEALEVGAASAVQVLQMGEEAPTIILIEEEDVASEATK